MDNKTLKNNNYLKTELTGDLPIDLHAKEKYVKDFINLGITDELMMVKIGLNILQLSKTEENLLILNKINDLLLQLSKDKVCQKYMGI